MASCVGGTVLALTAASLLAVTLATGSWWSGHPDINGQTISAKTVHIGMLVAEGCNTGGDGACKALELGGAFNATRYAVAGTTALTLLALLGVALLTITRSERRKLFAGLVFAGAVLGMLAAIALLVQGPDLKTNAKVAVPLGWGLYVFGGAIVTAIGSGVVALRPLPPPPRTVLAPPGWSGHAAPPAAMPPGGVDMAALMQESALRPSEPAPPGSRPPMAPVPPSPGGILPGPSGPLGVAPAPSAPLFSSAPQLRPLYEAAPTQGGTSGFQPQPPPPLAMRAPTPVPRSQISAKHGIPTPPPLEVPSALARPKSKSLPPPVRSKPMTAPPPLPAANPPRPASTTRPPPSPTKPPLPKPTFTAPAAIPPRPFLPPPPVRQMTEDMTIDRQKEDPFDVAATRAHVKEDPSDFDAAETSLPADGLATEAQPSLAVGDHTDVNAGFAESTSPAASAFESTGEREIMEALERDRLEGAKRAATDTDIAAAKAATPAPVLTKPPISTAPESLPPPQEKEVATSGPSPACPQCEAPMAWVEAHLRFYCKSCKMYF